jgi:ketosteroid isomerase-like protein
MAGATPTDVRVLLDKNAIEELVYEFDYRQDDGDPIGAVERYCTEDVQFDAGSLGRTEGKDAMKEVAEEVSGEELLFTRHMRHNPVVDVDGDEATGKWYAEIPSITGDGKAIWLQGIYELGFRRVDDEWKISRYTFDFTYARAYDRGWAEQPFVEGIPGELDW